MALTIQENIDELYGIESGMIRLDQNGQRYTLINYSGFGKALIDLINTIVRLFKEAFSTNEVNIKTNLYKQKISTDLYLQIEGTCLYREDLKKIIEGLKQINQPNLFNAQIDHLQELLDSENRRKEEIRIQALPLGAFEEIVL